MQHHRTADAGSTLAAAVISLGIAAICLLAGTATGLGFILTMVIGSSLAAVLLVIIAVRLMSRACAPQGRIRGLMGSAGMLLVTTPAVIAAHSMLMQAG